MNTLHLNWDMDAAVHGAALLERLRTVALLRQELSFGDVYARCALRSKNAAVYIDTNAVEPFLEPEERMGCAVVLDGDNCCIFWDLNVFKAWKEDATKVRLINSPFVQAILGGYTRLRMSYGECSNPNGVTKTNGMVKEMGPTRVWECLDTREWIVYVDRYFYWRASPSSCQGQRYYMLDRERYGMTKVTNSGELANYHEWDILTDAREAAAEHSLAFKCDMVIMEACSRYN